MKEYKNKQFDLRLCDNMELMAQYPDNYFDLAVVDPPYGIDITRQFKDANKIGSKSMFRKTKGIVKKQWDKNIPKIKYFVELKRVSKNQIIWGGNYFLDNLGNTKCMLVWNKMNGTNNMADCELAWTSLDKSVRMFSLHHFSKNYEAKIHLTQKPKQLYRWTLLNFANKGMKILDTHLGSMSIAVAVDSLNKVEKMDLHLTGCEIDEEYFNKGVERLKRAEAQLSLF